MRSVRRQPPCDSSVERIRIAVNMKKRMCCVATLLSLGGAVAPQAINEFSAGISPGARPFGITVGPDGNLWFTERGANRIGRITLAGVVTEFSAGISEGAQLTEIVT